MTRIGWIGLLLDVFGTLAPDELIEVERMRAVKKAKRQYDADAPDVAGRMLILARTEYRMRVRP